ncbi:MAG: hypothetical protein WAR57_12950 [Candidatus Phosphoribacter sp.]
MSRLGVRTVGAFCALAGFLAAGCSSDPSATVTTEATATVPQSTAVAKRDAGWKADLALIVPGMAAIHPDLFHGVPETTLQAAVDELSGRVPLAADDELMVGVLRIVALVGAAGCEGHTGVFVWGAGTYPVDSMPLRLWLFGDDLVIVDALAPYESLVGARVDAIDGHPIADVLASVSPLVARDNDQTVRLATPRLVLIPQVLRGLGLADGGPITLSLGSGATGATGNKRTVDVEPIPIAAYNAWAGPYGLHLPVDPDVQYLARINDALWWVLRPDGTLVVQYNRVDRLPAEQLAKLRAALEDPVVRRVVLDVRHNFGGELSELDRMMKLLTEPPRAWPDGFFVVTGRNTFSAGSLMVARLQAQTDAVFVGEPMSGCPTTWGNPEELAQPHSGLVINVAHELSVGVDAADTRLNIEPDIPAILTLDTWSAGIDPALEAIVANRR